MLPREQPPCRVAGTVVVAAVVFCCTAVPYALMVDRGLDLGDYGDFQTVPYILGIAYPPGFPGYVIIGWLWSHLIPLGDVALRLNLLSVLAAACANAMVAALLVELGASAFVAFTVATLYGLTYQAWTHAEAASAHELGTACLFASVFAAVRWVASGHSAALSAATILAAAALATDDSTVLALPGLAVILSGRRYINAQRWLPWTAAVVVLACAFAYLPLRSAYVSSHNVEPTRSLGISAHDQFFDQSHPATLPNFIALVTGSASAAPRSVRTMLTPYQVLRTWNDFTAEVTEELGPLALALGLIATVLFLIDRTRIATGIALVSCGTALFFSSWKAESDVGRYVPRELLFLAVALAWCSLRTSSLQASARFAGRTAFAILILWVTVLDAAALSRIVDDRAKRDAHAVSTLLTSVNSGAIVIAPFTYAAPLAYAFYVEHRIPHAIVLCCDPAILRRSAKRLLASRAVFVLDREERVPKDDWLRVRRQRTDLGLSVWRVLGPGSTGGGRHKPPRKRHPGAAPTILFCLGTSVPEPVPTCWHIGAASLGWRSSHEAALPMPRMPPLPR